MLVKAYLDERDHSDGPVCAMAGFAGVEDQWTAFESDWLKAIHPRGALHMKSLRLASKPERYRAMLARAGAVPHRCGLVAIGTTAFRNDYIELVQGTDLEAVLDPYMVCFQYTVAEMLSALGRNQRLQVFLEEQTKYRDRVNAFYAQVFRMRKHDPRLVGMTLLGKDEAIGFQAPDYLAYHLAKDNADSESQKAILTRPIKGQRGLQRDDIERVFHSTRISLHDLELEELAFHKSSMRGDSWPESL